MGQLLHCIRDAKPIPAQRQHRILAIDVRQACRDANRPHIGPQLTALSAAPLVQPYCQHGAPRDYELAAMRSAPWLPVAGVKLSRGLL